MLFSRFVKTELALLLVCWACSFAQTTVSTPSAGNDFSKESVVIEKARSVVTFQNDGRFTTEQYVQARIQSDAGVQQYGLLSFPYEASNGGVQLQYVQITKPTGEVVKTPLDSIQEVTSGLSQRAGMYSDIREKHIPVKGLQAGDILEYSVRFYTDKPLIPGQFWMNSHFVKNMVSLDEELELRAPRERAIKIKSETIQPTVRENGGYRIYTWKTSNLESKSQQKQAQALTYDGMRGLLPPPDVLVSTFQTWDEIGRWYETLQREKIQPSAAIRAKAEDIIKGLTDDEAKIRAIYNYVSLHNRYIFIGFGVGRYQPHTADEILGNQYGDCKDKHTLLAALLGAVGIRAYPALINSQGVLENEVPSPAQFDHVISLVVKGKEFYWMDTTPELTAMGYLMPVLRGKPALVLRPDRIGFETTPSSASFPNIDSSVVTGKLDADGTLQAHSETTFRGGYELYFRTVFRRVPEAQWEDYGQKNFYGGTLGGIITNVKVSSPEKTDEPFVLTYDYTLRNFTGATKDRFVIPLSSTTIPTMSDDDLRRTTPMWIGYPTDALYECHLELPKGWSASQPVALDLTENFAEFHGSTESDGNVLVTKRRLLLKVDAVTPDQLKSYKAFQKKISDNHALYIFLHGPVSPPASGPVSTPAQGLARATELARQSTIVLPGSSNSEALQSEQDAWKAMSAKDYASAITALRHAVSLDSTFSRAWIELAMTYYSGARSADLSLDAFQKAVEADPKQIIPYKILAFMYIGLGKRDDAVATWKKLQSIAPGDPDLKANFSEPR